METKIPMPLPLFRRFFAKTKAIFIKLCVNWRHFLHRHILGILFSALLLFATIVVLWPHVYVKIPAGHGGILFRNLGGGTDLSLVLKEGGNFVWPWNRVTTYDLRIRKDVQKVDVVTSDRLKTTVNYAYQFEVYYNTLPLFHKSVGPDFLDNVIRPVFTGTIREVYSLYSADEAFTAKSEEINDKIFQLTNLKLLESYNPAGLGSINFYELQGFEILSIQYAPDVEAALDAKAVELAKAEAFKYKIQAAKSEAQRKQIEAEGIAKFQETVKAGLTDNYLKYIGVQATEALAKSENSKVVVFGNSPGGLPLILGDQDKNIPSRAK
jgi:regulator of protease activity HflC (stomatin/prohibitin superfamily)